jgi:hypothetical protein
LKFSVYGGSCEFLQQQTSGNLVYQTILMGNEDTIVQVDSQYYPSSAESSNSGPYYSTTWFYLYTPVAEALNVASGNQQNVLGGQYAPQPLTVQALWSNGQAAAGIPVVFTVSSSSSSDP